MHGAGGQRTCPVGRGPRAPPKNAYPAAGHMGPALQVHTPKKNNAVPLAGRRAFSVHVWHRRRRVIFAAFTSGNRVVNSYLETTVYQVSVP